MDGRSICTPRWVSACPFAEPRAQRIKAFQASQREMEIGVEGALFELE